MIARPSPMTVRLLFFAVSCRGFHVSFDRVLSALLLLVVGLAWPFVCWSLSLRSFLFWKSFVEHNNKFLSIFVTVIASIPALLNGDKLVKMLKLLCLLSLLGYHLLDVSRGLLPVVNSATTSVEPVCCCCWCFSLIYKPTSSRSTASIVFIFNRSLPVILRSSLIH